MKTKMQQYLEMVEQLKKFGEELVEEYYEQECEEHEEFIDEVECMGEHLKICERILKESL